jgi:hypothetical protein
MLKEFVIRAALQILGLNLVILFPITSLRRHWLNLVSLSNCIRIVCRVQGNKAAT